MHRALFFFLSSVVLLCCFDFSKFNTAFLIDVEITGFNQFYFAFFSKHVNILFIVMQGFHHIIEQRSSPACASSDSCYVWKNSQRYKEGDFSDVYVKGSALARN